MSNILKKTSNDNIQKYHQFMFERKVDRGADRSHTSLGDPKGCYLIQEKDKDKFFKLYKKAINDKAEIYLSEGHRHQGPIIIDIDIKYPKDLKVEERIYKKFLIPFLRIYNEIVTRFLDPTEEEFLTFIFEKKEATARDDCFKDGIHIMYPEICASNKLQYVMRNELVNKINDIKLFEGIGLINKTEDIIDKAVIETNNWMLYGSCKPGTPPYVLTEVLDYELKQLDKSKWENDIIYEYLSIRKFSKDDLTDYREGFDESIIMKEYEKLNKKKVIIGKKVYNVVSNQEDIKNAKELTELLNQDRAKAYDTWLNLGFCLHNIDYCLLETWIEFSKLSPGQFKEGECEKLWDGFRNNNYSLGSLYRWAREDNPDKYATFLLAKTNEAILESIDGTSYSIAKAFHKIYRFNYICANIKSNLWYEYKNHRWVECEDGHTIFGKLNEDIAIQYQKLAYALHTKALLPTITAKEKEDFMDKKKKVEKIYEKIRNVSLKQNIIKECQTIFYDPIFASNLNENKNVLVFNNGVYDFKEHVFRDGLPEDYMSYTTGVNYYKFDENNNYVKEIDNYFHSIQPDEVMKKYILDLLSSCLVGNIPDEKFQIWTGTGCHGKGTRVLMYDGNYRNVEDVQVEEFIMGDDSRRRLVSQVFKGVGKMYRVNQLDFNSSYTVNVDHILSLRIINSKYVFELAKVRKASIYQNEGYYYIDLPVEEYLKLSDDYKKILYGYKRKILDNHHYNNEWNIKLDEVVFDKDLYKNTRNYRLIKRMMILDTIIEEGSHININKYDDYTVEEIIKLCHSVGYHIVYHEDHIRVYKDILPVSRINIIELENGEFFGFEINCNHRYMMEDCTITHNSNGKSLTVDMLHEAMKDYSAEVQVTLLTQKRPDATAANPELARTKGKRFITLQEPENEDKLQLGYLKSLTGGAKVSTRTLHEKTFEFEPQFKLFLLCNKVPDIPSNDGGTWRRIRVTPWEMKFVDNPVKPNERVKDNSLKEKIKSDPWKEALLSFLIHHFETYVKGKTVIEPQKVLQHTQIYQNKSDLYQNFMNEKIEITGNKKDRTTWKIMYEEFKSWFLTNRNSKTTIKATEFKIEIQSKIPVEYHDSLIGVRVKLPDDHEDKILSDDEGATKQAYV
jgi:P4 family phage/plasmid primase-like protien